MSSSADPKAEYEKQTGRADGIASAARPVLAPGSPVGSEGLQPDLPERDRVVVSGKPEEARLAVLARVG